MKRNNPLFAKRLDMYLPLFLEDSGCTQHRVDIGWHRHALARYYGLQPGEVVALIAAIKGYEDAFWCYSGEALARLRAALASEVRLD